MNIREEAGEDDSTLLNKVSDLLGKQDITLSPHQVIAIHRIPGKPGSPKPVLMKVVLQWVSIWKNYSWKEDKI